MKRATVALRVLYLKGEGRLPLPLLLKEKLDMAKDVNRVVAKFQARVAASGDEYAAGVNAPNRDWLQAYQKAQPRMKQALQDAIAKDKFVKGAQASGGTANWQQSAASKGARNYAAAATDAATNYAKKADLVMQAAQAAQKATEGMPDTTFEQRQQKSLAAQKAIHDFWASH